MSPLCSNLVYRFPLDAVEYLKLVDELETNSQESHSVADDHYVGTFHRDVAKRADAHFFGTRFGHYMAKCVNQSFLADCGLPIVQLLNALWYRVMDECVRRADAAAS